MSQQTIAVSGSRYLNTAAVSQAVGAVMLSAGPGVTWAIGCCPTGLDAAARALAKAYSLNHKVYRASSGAAAALRARTLAMVTAAGTLVAFPVSAKIISSGTWLAVSRAAAAGKAVFVHAPWASAAGALPAIGNITGWRQATIPGIPAAGTFWVPVVNSVQTSLF